MTWVVIAILSWPILVIGFFAYAKALELDAREVTFTWWVRFPLKVGFYVGAAADIIFNVTWGSAIFLETPRELFFSQRVSRHWKANPNDQKAIEWRDRINKILPGHIR